MGISHHEHANVSRSDSVRALSERHAAARGPLLPILHDVIAEHGYVANEDIPVIADVLNLSRAEVHGVVSFYHDFRRTPPPRHAIRICRGEACQAVGSEELYASVASSHAADQDVEVSEVFCLGNCALGPSGMVDGHVLGRLTPQRLASAFTVPTEVRQ